MGSSIQRFLSQWFNPTRVARRAVTGCLMLVAGCDVGVRGTQRLDLTIVDRHTELGVAGAKIRCDSDQGIGYIEAPDGTLTRIWSSTAVSGNDGSVKLIVDTITIRGGLDAWGIRLEDEISGKVFSFEIEKDGLEIIRIPMYERAAGTGERFTLTIHEIGRPTPEDKRAAACGS